MTQPQSKWQMQNTDDLWKLNQGIRRSEHTAQRKKDLHKRIIYS